jgi:hypothetical protein
MSPSVPVVSKSAEPHLVSLKHEFESADDMLRILAWYRDGECSPHYYLKGDSELSYFECNEEDKIRIEIARWQSALRNTAGQPPGDVALRSLSLALHSIKNTLSARDLRDLFARTRRMLLLLEWILLAEQSSEDNPYSELRSFDQHKTTSDRLRQLREDLREVVIGQNVVLTLDGGKWVASLPLLAVVAVAECQCEYAQPFAWEAYSAGRARDELMRKWAGVNDKVLNTIALMIRNQSAVGQRQRKSGSMGFVALVESGLDQLAFDKSLTIRSLQLLAIVGEARNHTVPAPRHTQSDSGINDGCKREWGYKEQADRISSYLDFDVAPAFDSTDDSPDNYTWSWFRPEFLGVVGEHAVRDVEAFKKSVLLAKRNPAFRGSISVGRTQIQPPLQAVLGAILTGWGELSPADAARRFTQYFRLRTLEVPHPFSITDKEHILQVLLRDDLAAERLLFPSHDSPETMVAQASEPPIEIRHAGDLFKYVFDVAKRNLSLEDDRMWDEDAGSISFPLVDKPVYVPFPLVRRITDIVHRLQPETCFNIPISIDRTTTEWIHIPYGIEKQDHIHKRVLATFILARVLNKAMAAGLTRAEIDLENLSVSATNMPSVDKGGRDIRDDLMQPSDWRETIHALYFESGYNILLDRYLRDYNSQRRNIYFKTRLSPDTQVEGNRIGTLSVGEIRADLKRYLLAMCESKRPSEAVTGNEPDCWLLGVDIGRTLTKCQLYGYWASSQDFHEFGPVFRMSTPPAANPEVRHNVPVQTVIKERTSQFAARLIDLAKNRVGEHLERIGDAPLVIGLSWPGPVRENYPNGTSGLLEVFGLSPLIPENRIDDIWQVDLAGAVGDAWAHHFKGVAPFVALLNDGDAEALGAVVIAERRQNGSQALIPPDTLSVVKLGSGLAGAMLTRRGGGLQLVPGLYEWGKLILDVGAPARSGFPKGAARNYLSQTCLPRLARRLGAKDKCFLEQHEPDSAEIGLIIETDNSLDPVGAYQKLRLECGSIQGFRHPIYGIPVSAEVLRVVYNKLESDPDLVFEVRLFLKVFEAVGDRLKEHVDTYGRIRLERLIGYAPQLPTDKEECDALRSSKEFRRASEIAKCCAESLGRYLGDFCVLLYDELGVGEVYLTGGVLTGETGKSAIAAASNRMAIYDLRIRESRVTESYIIEQLDNNRTAGGAENPRESFRPVERVSLNVERGAFGAACFAAALFIQEKKQQGLQKLRSLLLELDAGALVEVQGTTVVISSAPDNVDFQRYALSESDLQRFLELRGPDWGFYKTNDALSFVRWR